MPRRRGSRLASGRGGGRSKQRSPLVPTTAPRCGASKRSFARPTVTFSSACSFATSVLHAAWLARPLPRRLPREPRVEVIADPAQRLARDATGVLAVERAVLPLVVLAGVE